MALRKLAKSLDVFSFCCKVCKANDRFGWREMGELWYRINSARFSRENI